MKSNATSKISNSKSQTGQPTFTSNLSPKEIADPHLAIKSFFFNYGLCHSKKYISKWMNALYNKDAKWVKKKPGELLFFLDSLYVLIEAAWLINKMDNSGRIGNLSLNHDIENIDFMNPEFYSVSKTREDLWMNFPRSLRKEHYINPYSVFPKFFNVHSLDKWKDELRYFLIVALSDFEIDDIDTLKYKNLLDNLIDACCLICEREFSSLEL